MRFALFFLFGLALGCSESPSDFVEPVYVLPPANEVSFDSPPIPAFGAVPTPQQLAWQNMEVNAFIVFGPNTFTGREWGTGTESPSRFAPTALDARQWARAARAGGIRGLILTAKHHEGFALWPSAHTTHDVAASPWRGGRGDLVREFADATRAEGLEVGIYLSPWDRHEPTWGTEAYNDFYVTQMEELTRPGPDGYGPLFEVWLDAAHGEDVTQAQKDTYDVQRWHRAIRAQQPGTLIAFSHDIQYSGTEEGRIAPTTWNDRGGVWSPTECNTAFRTGWFWHPGESPKSLRRLIDIYFRTVGQDCVLLLGLAPDRRGLLEDEDVWRLREWRLALDGIFDEDLGRGRVTAASSTRPGSAGWTACAATDGDPASFWVADDTTGWLEIDLGAAVPVNIIEVREPIWYGQRIGAFAIDAEIDGAWREIASGTTVGRRRLLRIESATSRRWRLRIDAARAVPAVNTFGLYHAPNLIRDQFYF